MSRDVCRSDTKTARVGLKPYFRPRDEYHATFYPNEDWLSGKRPHSIGLWRWMAYQGPGRRYTHWLLKAQAGELPGVYRASNGQWMVAIDWDLIDAIGLEPALKKLGWVTVHGQLPGQAPGSATEPKPEG